MRHSKSNMPGYALSILFFQVAGRLLGTDLKWVREVVPARQLSHIPNANSFVAGVVNIRGDVISVLDARFLLKNQDSDMRWDRIILIDTTGAPVGLAVDTVLSVQAVMPETFSAISKSDLDYMPEQFISGVTSWNSERIPLLHIPALMAHLQKNIPHTKEARA